MSARLLHALEYASAETLKNPPPDKVAMIANTKLNTEILINAIVMFRIAHFLSLNYLAK